MADGDIYLYNKPGGQGTGGKGKNTSLTVSSFICLTIAITMDNMDFTSTRNFTFILSFFIECIPIVFFWPIGLLPNNLTFPTDYQSKTKNHTVIRFFFYMH